MNVKAAAGLGVMSGAAMGFGVNEAERARAESRTDIPGIALGLSGAALGLAAMGAAFGKAAPSLLVGGGAAATCGLVEYSGFAPSDTTNFTFPARLSVAREI